MTHDTCNDMTHAVLFKQVSIWNDTFQFVSSCSTPRSVTFYGHESGILATKKREVLFIFAMYLILI